MNPVDFDLENGTLLGCGAIAFVNRCRHGPSENHFAVKSVSKIQALQQGKTEGLRHERSALLKFSSFYPGVAHLFGTMQSVDEIYFVMENLTRGDLMEHIKRTSGTRRLKDGKSGGFCLTKRDTQKIIIQVVLTLKLLWENGMVHRDLKPENVAFHSNGRVVLIDFDTVLLDAPKLTTGKNNLPSTTSATNNNNNSMKNEQESSSNGDSAGGLKISDIQAMRKKSQAFCGTAQFVSPETLHNCDWTFASDLFALGSLVYFMLSGRPIFDGPNTFAVLGKIKQGAENIPLEQWSEGVRECPGAVSLIRKLLSQDPRDRFCCRRHGHDSSDKEDFFTFDLESFKNHEFFAGEEAQNLWTRFEQEDEEFIASQKKSDPEMTMIERLAKPHLTPCARAKTVYYDDEPKHDDEYSQYALTAGASDIERWWHDAIEGVASSVEPSNNHDDDDVEAENDVPKNFSNDDDDESMHVVDDVGQQQFVTSNNQAFSQENESQNKSDDE